MIFLRHLRLRSRARIVVLVLRQALSPLTNFRTRFFLCSTDFSSSFWPRFFLDSVILLLYWIGTPSVIFDSIQVCSQFDKTLWRPIALQCNIFCSFPCDLWLRQSGFFCYRHQHQKHYITSLYFGVSSRRVYQRQVLLSLSFDFTFTFLSTVFQVHLFRVISLSFSLSKFDIFIIIVAADRQAACYCSYCWFTGRVEQLGYIYI